MAGTVSVSVGATVAVSLGSIPMVGVVVGVLVAELAGSVAVRVTVAL